MERWRFFRGRNWFAQNVDPSCIFWRRLALRLPFMFAFSFEI